MAVPRRYLGAGRCTDGQGPVHGGTRGPAGPLPTVEVSRHERDANARSGTARGSVGSRPAQDCEGVTLMTDVEEFEERPGEGKPLRYLAVASVVAWILAVCAVCVILPLYSHPSLACGLAPL